ncbi:hypothetical protein LG202_17240 [Methylobacillus methanolivorans]
MPLILLIALMALLPLVMTSALTHILLVSIYAGLAHLLTFMVITILLQYIMRWQQVAKWRARRATLMTSATARHNQD